MPPSFCMCESWCNMNKKWCVYVHISPNKKYYVGITSQKPNDRWKNGKGYDYNSYFTRAIQKYGWDNFQHEIVASNLTEEEAKNFEKILIEKLKSNIRKYGYNLSAGGDGVSGVQRFGEDNSFYGKHHSDESRKKISKSRMGKYCGKDNPNFGHKLSNERIEEIRKSKSVSVCQFDLDMNFVQEFSSTKEAENATGDNHSLISRVCRGKLKTIHGHIWLYSSDARERGLLL